MTDNAYLKIEQLDPERVFVFEKYEIIDEDNLDANLKDIVDSDETYTRTSTLVGMRSINDPAKYHKYIGFNKFTTDVYDMVTKEDGYLDLEEQLIYKFENNFYCGDFEEFRDSTTKYRNEMINKSICNINAQILTPDKYFNHHDYPGWDIYRTEDNGGTGFLVLINKENNYVRVHGRSFDVLPNGVHGKKIFNRCVGEYEPLEIFIGKSKFNQMTDFSGGYGENWDGNSILLRIGLPTEYKYLYIGTNIVEFETDEKITKYVSSVGNSRVPYPYAESDNWCYCMLDFKKSPIDRHPNRRVRGYIQYRKKAEYIDFDHYEISPRNIYDCVEEYIPHSSGWLRPKKLSWFSRMKNLLVQTPTTLSDLIEYYFN